MSKIFLVFVVILTLFGCASLKNGEQLQNGPPKIQRINWIIYNMPIGFFDTWVEKQTCAVDFSIVYSGEIEEGEIVSAGFDNPFYSSQFAIENNIDYRNKTIGINHKYFSLWTVEPYVGSVFCIGPTVFWFQTKTGGKYTYKMDIPAPGKLTSEGCSYVYTEDFNYSGKTWNTNLSYKSVSCLMRPLIITDSVEEMELNIDFVLNDNRFFSGGVVFYDEGERVIAYTEPFCSYNTHKISMNINGGMNINNDGSKNNVRIDLSTLKFFENFGIQDIAGYYIIVTDGFQYKNTTQSYDCITYSERRNLRD